MRRLVRLGLVLVIAVIAAIARQSTTSAPPPAVVSAQAPQGPKAVESTQLPAEAVQTLALIDSGGPFPFDRDGIEFHNAEGHLPKQPRGYYREYTVPTPGAKTRGARRVIAGQGGERYYTDDHYETFRRVK